MKKVYIIYSYTGTYFSRFLRMMTDEKYVHVSICLDSNLKEVYSFGRQNPRWMFPCGFVNEDFQLISNLFQNAECQVYELQLSLKKWQALKHELQKYIDKRNAYHYNIKGLIHIKFNHIYRRQYHYVCSQFVGKLIQDSQIYDFQKDYSLINPHDVISIPNLNLIYEGKINNYIKEFSNEKINVKTI